MHFRMNVSILHFCWLTQKHLQILAQNHYIYHWKMQAVAYIVIKEEEEKKRSSTLLKLKKKNVKSSERERETKNPFLVKKVCKKQNKRGLKKNKGVWRV